MNSSETELTTQNCMFASLCMHTMYVCTYVCVNKHKTALHTYIHMCLYAYTDNPAAGFWTSLM